MVVSYICNDMLKMWVKIVEIVVDLKVELICFVLEIVLWESRRLRFVMMKSKFGYNL